MKKILVPTDFSKYAEYALEVAAQIATKKNAEIIVLHMMGLAHSEINKTSNQEAIEAIFNLKLSEKKFKEFLNKDFLKGIKVTDKVLDEKSFGLLNNLAQNENIDLVVMGSHGTTGLLQDVFVGSNTEKMVRNANVPVLVIKERMQDFKLDKVVFACDFKDENVKAYNKAINLFKDFDADLNMVYINTPNKFMTTLEMEKEKKNFMDTIGSDTLKMQYFDDFSVEEGVFNYSDMVDADVIAIPTHGRKGLAHFFVGSIGEDIANHATKPVMTFKI